MWPWRQGAGAQADPPPYDPDPPEAGVLDQVGSWLSAVGDAISGSDAPVTDWNVWGGADADEDGPDEEGETSFSLPSPLAAHVDSPMDLLRREVEDLTPGARANRLREALADRRERYEAVQARLREHQSARTALEGELMTLRKREFAKRSPALQRLAVARKARSAEPAGSPKAAAASSPKPGLNRALSMRRKKAKAEPEPEVEMTDATDFHNPLHAHPGRTPSGQKVPRLSTVPGLRTDFDLRDPKAKAAAEARRQTRARRVVGAFSLLAMLGGALAMSTLITDSANDSATSQVGELLGVLVESAENGVLTSVSRPLRAAEGLADRLAGGVIPEDDVDGDAWLLGLLDVYDVSTVAFAYADGSAVGAGPGYVAAQDLSTGWCWTRFDAADGVTVLEQDCSVDLRDSDWYAAALAADPEDEGALMAPADDLAQVALAARDPASGELVGVAAAQLDLVEFSAGLDALLTSVFADRAAGSALLVCRPDDGALFGATATAGGDDYCQTGTRLDADPVRLGEAVDAFGLVAAVQTPRGVWFDFVDASARNVGLATGGVVLLFVVLVAALERRASTSHKKPGILMSETEKEAVVSWNAVVVVAQALVLFVLIVTMWLGSVTGEIDDIVTDRVLGIADLVQAASTAFLALPQQTVDLQANAEAAGVLAFGDIANRSSAIEYDAFYLGALGVFPEVQMVYAGLTDGEFIGAKEFDGSVLAVSVLDASTDGVLYYLEASGRARNESLVVRSVPGYDPRERPWYVSASAAETTWSPVYLFASGGLGVTATRAFNGTGDADDDAVGGVYAADFSLDVISDFLSSLDFGSDTEGTAFVVERTYTEGDGVDGALIATTGASVQTLSGERAFARDSDDEVIVQADAELRARFGSYADMEDGWVGVVGAGSSQGERIVSVSRLDDGVGIDWVVVLTFSRAEFYAAVEQRTDEAILIGLGILLLLVFTVSTFASFHRPTEHYDANAASISAMSRDDRAELNEVATFLSSADRMQLADLLMSFHKRAHRRAFLDACKQLFAEELQGFVRVLKTARREDRDELRSKTDNMTAKDVLEFLRTIPGVSGDDSQMFYEREARELRLTVQFAGAVAALPPDLDLRALTSGMPRDDVAALLTAVDMMPAADKPAFVREVAALPAGERCRHCEARIAQLASADLAPASAADMERAIGFILEASRGRKVVDLLYYAIHGRYAPRLERVYRLVTSARYRLWLDAVTVFHCMLTFSEAPATHSTPEAALAPFSASYRALVLGLEAACLAAYLVDVPLQFASRGLFKYGIVQGQFQRQGLRFTPLLLAAVLLAMLVDWAWRCADWYATGTAALPLLLPYTALLRPVVSIVRQPRLRATVRSFFATVVFAQDVAVLYGLFLTVGAVFGLMLFTGSDFYDEGANPYDNVIDAWREMFVFMTTAENFPDLAHPPADRRDGAGGSFYYSYYFVLFAMIGTLVAMSLIIAIFEDQFSIHSGRQRAKRRREAHRGIVVAFLILDKDESGVLEAAEFKEFCSSRMRIDFPDDATLSVTEFVELCEQLLYRLELAAPGAAGGRLVARAAAAAERAVDGDRYAALRAAARAHLGGVAHQRVMLLVAVAYLWTLGTYATFESTAATDAACTAFLLLYSAETLLRLWAAGRVMYWWQPQDVYRQMANRYDLVVTCVFFLAWVGSRAAGPTTRESRVILALPALRIFSTVGTVRALFFGLLSALPAQGHVLALMCITIYGYAIAGCQLFGGRWFFLSDDVYDMPSANFDSMSAAVQTLFQLLIGEAWPSVMHAAITSNGQAAALYFVSWIVLVGVLFTTLFASIVIVAFKSIEELRRTKGTDGVTEHEMQTALGGHREYRFFHIQLPASPEEEIKMRKQW